MKQKFKAGDRVRVCAGYSSAYALEGATGKFLAYDGGDAWFTPDAEHVVDNIREVCIHPDNLEAEHTPESIAPILYNTYKDTLNDEALEALRQVILDAGNHGRMNFEDADNVDDAFRWRDTKQGEDFWCDVDCGKYDKPVSAEDFGATASEQEDIGSAATSKHYNSKLIQPIQIAQMVLTAEEFKGAMKFNIMKYTQRAGSKEGESSQKDWNKALQYKLWLELAEAGVVIDPKRDIV